MHEYYYTTHTYKCAILLLSLLQFWPLRPIPSSIFVSILPFLMILLSNPLLALYVCTSSFTLPFHLNLGHPSGLSPMVSPLRKTFQCSSQKRYFFTPHASYLVESIFINGLYNIQTSIRFLIDQSSFTLKNEERTSLSFFCHFDFRQGMTCTYNIRYLNHLVFVIKTVSLQFIT